MKKNLLAAIFFLILSFIIIFSWFRSGLIFGGGDVGLQTYNPIRVIERAVFVWWDSLAPGTTIPQGLTAVPFQSLLALLQLVGFSPLLIQATFFFVILFSMGFGMYFLLRHSFGMGFRLAILGGVFYMLNPYMMIQIWHRFVHSSFFLVAAMPFLILFWSDWIKNKKIGSLLLFLLVNLIASYLFGTIAYIVTVWLILFLVALAESIFPWEGIRRSSQLFLRFFIGLLLWVLTNIWWLVPVATITPALVSQQHDPSESLVTLINISRQAVLPYSLQMVNPFYLFLEGDFGKFYQNPLVRFLPWILVGFILAGLIKGLKDKIFVKWAVIFLVVLSLAKGSSPPFGYSFILGFEHFFPLGVLRNPFEKMGILLPFVGTILFIFGIKSILEYVEKKIGRIYQFAFLALILLVIFVFHWPMFTPEIFGKIGKPAFVKVPTSYSQANEWIKKDSSNKEKLGKILHLPLTRGESINYKWEYGYGGIEPSDLFFTALPSISRGFNLKRVDDFLAAFYISFHTNNPEIILRLLRDLNVHYLVLHKDVIWRGGDFFDPANTEKILDNLHFLNRAQSFGDLIIYKVKDEYRDNPVIVAANYQIIYPSDKSLTWPYLIGGSEGIITPLDNNDSEISANAIRQIIFPNASFTFPSKLYVVYALNKLVTDEPSINQVLTPLTKIAPALAQNGEFQAEKLNDLLIESTKKVIGMFRSQYLGQPVTKSTIDEYEKIISDILSKQIRDSRLRLYLNEMDLGVFFQIHLNILEALAEKSDPQNKVRLTQLAETMRKWMIENNLSSVNPLAASEAVVVDERGLPDRQKAFRFKIPTTEKYEILIAVTSGKEFFKDGREKFKISINGQAQEFTGKDLGNMISLGTHEFPAGDLELTTDVHISSDLTQTFDQLTKFGTITQVDNAIKVEPLGQYGYIESFMPDTTGGDIVRVSFEILAQNTNGFYFQLAQDSDNEDKSGRKMNQIDEFITLTPNNWQSLFYTLPPLKPATQQASIRLVVASGGRLPPPHILMRNLTVEKVLNADIVLRSTDGQQEELVSDDHIAGQVISLNKINPTLYKGIVEIKNPSFLFFSETYHPSWKLKLTDGKNTYYPQKHVMANLYGNGWYIKDIGSYSFTLEFEPQRMVYYGAMIAVFTYLGLLVLILRGRFRK